MKKLLALLLCLPLWSVAQDSPLGNWINYFGNKVINEQWNWHNEVQYRNYNAIGDLEQLLIRTGVGYNLTEGNNNVLLGYGYILSENYVGEEEKESVNEHRIFQQFITKHAIGVVNVQHRYRFEQRWVESDFKMRLRYFLSLNIPLNRKPITDGSWYGSVYNEIFLNTGENVFDRNRLYVALGHQFSKKFRLEVGYMNQYLPGLDRDQININSFLTF
ncbi:DUF2490 domain-containing protein [Cryomorphaceae bacterium]|nr:DUF2490 domain-containing protein [Cryomorphaceae bacterium]